MTHKIDGTSVARTAETLTTAATRAGGERSQPVAATPASDSIRLTGDAESLQALGRELGAAPAGVDLDRVNALRAAISDGSYQVDAQAIATRMLQLDRELGG